MRSRVILGHPETANDILRYIWTSRSMASRNKAIGGIERNEAQSGTFTWPWKISGPHVDI